METPILWYCIQTHCPPSAKHSQDMWRGVVAVDVAEKLLAFAWFVLQTHSSSNCDVLKSPRKDSHKSLEMIVLAS